MTADLRFTPDAPHVETHLDLTLIESVRRPEATEAPWRAQFAPPAPRATEVPPPAPVAHRQPPRARVGIGPLVLLVAGGGLAGLGLGAVGVALLAAAFGAVASAQAVVLGVGGALLAAAGGAVSVLAWVHRFGGD